VFTYQLHFVLQYKCKNQSVNQSINQSINQSKSPLVRVRKQSLKVRSGIVPEALSVHKVGFVSTI
jgi:hypothetical protein